MKNAIIYFLTGLFLLFVVESRLNVNTLRNDYTTHNSQNLPKRANRLNQTLEKISVQQQADNVAASSFELSEGNFQISDAAKTILVFASVFGFIYVFGLNYRKRLKPQVFDFVTDILSVKRFIFIRSIRI
ncbi:hypothetical protein [Chryseobacterium sp. GP-SGM7]|uniref:hypothetical protein n=1 Tax=Chryseobacterium sp. GP-SGM7 TaxID=3411323 RepID=UPI003B96246E